MVYVWRRLFFLTVALHRKSEEERAEASSIALALPRLQSLRIDDFSMQSLFHQLCRRADQCNRQSLLHTDPWTCSRVLAHRNLQVPLDLLFHPQGKHLFGSVPCFYTRLLFPVKPNSMVEMLLRGACFVYDRMRLIGLPFNSTAVPSVCCSCTTKSRKLCPATSNETDCS